MGVTTERVATAGMGRTSAEAAVGEGRAVRRLAGWSALAFAAGVVVANSSMVGAPMPWEPVADAASWYAANAGRAMLAPVMVALTFPALLIFGACMYELARSSGRARAWMLVGGLGGAAMVGTFTLVAASQIASVLLAEADGASFGAAWVIHNGAFAVNMSVLGTAFLGFAVGTRVAGLTPGWHGVLGVIGAALLLATGFANAWVAAGSFLVLPGFAGFLLWLVWLVVGGVWLLRAR